MASSTGATATEVAAARRAVRCIVASAQAAQVLAGSIPDAAITVIPNGVDVGFFGSAEAKAEWQGRTIGFIGRIDEPRKGLPVLMKALPAILAEVPDARLLVAGRGDEEEAVATLPAEMRSRVEFLGMVSDEDKARLLRSVDLYVAPNTGGESFGIVTAEAMAAGVPVVATSAGSLPEVVGDAAVLVEPGDHDGLVEALTRCLGDEDERHRLIAAGTAWSARYSWERCGEELEALYRDAAAEHG